MHGQRTPTPEAPATGTTTGALGGAPVVALDLTIEGLLRHADQARTNRRVILANAQAVASTLAREADYLESLAAALAGATDPRSTP